MVSSIKRLLQQLKGFAEAFLAHENTARTIETENQELDIEIERHRGMPGPT